MTPEAELASRYREIERIYREQGPRLWRAMYAWTGDRDVTDDVTAEAFAQLLRRGLEVLDPQAWLGRSVFRIAGGERQRRAARAGPHRGERAERAEPRMEDAGHALVEVLDALRALSPLQRGSLLLHDYIGCSAAETADILDSTAGAVRVHLVRGRRRVRTILGTA